MCILGLGIAGHHARGGHSATGHNRTGNEATPVHAELCHIVPLSVCIYIRTDLGDVPDNAGSANLRHTLLTLSRTGREREVERFG